jgi:hypothetical protein
LPKQAWTFVALAACLMLAACSGSGGSWTWWQIALLILLIIVVIVVVVLVVIWIGPEVVLGAIAELIEIILELIGTALARLWIFLVETTWPWIVRLARWLWSLLVRAWNWLRTVAWPWIVDLVKRFWAWILNKLARFWTWFKGSRLGQLLIALWFLIRGNVFWDALKSAWAWLWGGGPPTLVYPPVTYPCPFGTALSATASATETENDYPFGMTAAAVAAAAATSAIASATAAAKANLAAQAAAIRCAGPCNKVVFPAIVVSTATTPATKVSHLGGFYDSYTVTATVTAVVTVQCM